jgi:UDP-glucose:(glucosyl)LPS alpha-1,2-glucosyltransferase
MVQILNGKILKEDITINAMGGTEMMAHRMLRDINPELLNEFQIIHSRVRDLDDSKRKILVVHDLPTDPELIHLIEESSRNRFDKIVFVGNWQAQQFRNYLGVPFSQSSVLYNAIEPIDISDKKYNGTVNIIYHTTPHRGLQILIPVFDYLCKKYDNLHLDVFSSFKIYGWESRDSAYKELFDICKNHPKITYHGSQPNEVIREKLKETHIYGYPSIWQECHSLAALEAMSSKNIVVCPNYGGLVDTTMGWARMYDWDEDISRHANTFAAYLENAILVVMNQSAEYHNELVAQKYFFDTRFNWNYRKFEWEKLLRSILNTSKT